MYYVDTYTWELVEEQDFNSPPERYYQYRKGVVDGVIIETYTVSYFPLKLIDFAHGVGEDRLMQGRTRDLFFAEHGVPQNAPLCAYTVPPNMYEKEVEKYKREQALKGGDEV